MPSLRQNRKDHLPKKGGGVFSPLFTLLKEHPSYLLIAIAVSGTLIRFLVSRQLLHNDPATFAPMRESDMATYIEIARNILQGKLPETFYYQPLYYSLFLPFCYLSGVSAGPAITAFLQGVLGGVTIFLAGKCAMRISGRIAGITAALLTAFSAILIYFTAYALLEILQAFFLILLFDLSLISLSRPNWKNWSMTGFVLALSMLTRGNTLFLLPVILFALFLRKSELFPRKKKFLYAALFLLFTFLPQLPFAAYNTYKIGHISGPSTAGGAVLALGNNPEAAPAGLEIPHTPSWQEWMKKEKSISIPRRILDHALKNPGAYLELKCKQFLLFWSQEDHGNNITEEYNAVKSPLMRTWHFLPTGVICALALASLFAGFYHRFYMRKKAFMLLAMFLFMYALSVTAFYILARFRLPVLPLMCIASGVFLGRLFHFYSFRSFLRYFLFLAAGVFICYGLYPLYSYVYEPLLMQKLLPHGVQVELEDPHFPGAALPNWNLSIMDASSMFQGGWEMVEIKENMIVKKEMILPEGFKLPVQGTLVLPVSSNGGSFSVEVNGMVKNFFSLPAEVTLLNLSKIPVLPETGAGNQNRQFHLRFYNVNGQTMIFFDNRRDYGRSYLDGKKVPFELALRLLLPMKK